MEEGEVLVLRLCCGFILVSILTMRESRNLEEAICRRKAGGGSANATNLNQRLQTHHPEQHKQPILDVQQVLKLL